MTPEIRARVGARLAGEAAAGTLASQATLAGVSKLVWLGGLAAGAIGGLVVGVTWNAGETGSRVETTPRPDLRAPSRPGAVGSSVAPPRPSPPPADGAGERELLLDLDFEDGQAPAILEMGEVAKGPA